MNALSTLSKLTVTMIAATAVASAVAGPTCTQEDKSTWMDQGKFKQQLMDSGYKIRKFKVTDGNCYEIYGHNKEGKRVEIYFNPITGEAVKSS